MNDKKDNIDDLINQALSEEESEILERLEEEQSIFEQMMANFKGKMKWLALYSIFIMLLLFAFAVYCFIQFLQAEEIRSMLLWGAGMGFGMMAVGMLKTWHWMQMDKNTILREIKRLELRMATLNKNNNS